MLEAELRKINGYYTQVNQEKNQLQGVLEEKMRELRENETTIHAREQNIKENNDMMELLRNQIQQYSRDYEEERVSREKFAQQFNKMQATLKDKDAEIDSLQDLLAKNATTRLKTGPDVCCKLMQILLVACIVWYLYLTCDVLYSLTLQWEVTVILEQARGNTDLAGIYLLC